ncbi:Hypothetical protein CINCED_3A001108 [Cinara cedri]|nr:Hypothetical protein CINCED_3A001108 [Cinara cedri]
MTSETCGNVSGSTSSGETRAQRHRAPLPPAEVKDASCGHEKFPSWPIAPVTATASGTAGTAKSYGMSATAARKSWADELQQTGNGYPKEQPPPIVRPYPKRLANGLYTQQLKTVMERCEKAKPDMLVDRVRSMRAKSGGYVDRLTAEKSFCVPLSLSTSTAADPAADLRSQLTQAQLEKYSRAYDDSPHRETDEYSSCFDGSDSALSSHLTKEELEHYTRIYEEKSTSQISLAEKAVPSHQHQASYAQSEGYHSYVSSTDSTSTPFLDRLRREADSSAVLVVGKETEKQPASAACASAAAAAQGRDSSASSGSSSETLKWHGSNSDLSTVSSVGHHRATTTQLIAHSAKVSAPQRHHSESVLSVTDSWSSAGSSADLRTGNHHQRNLRKLFPVSTYTVQPAAVADEKTSPKSPPALSVAERINELEKQQQQASNNKFMYYDPEKKHKVGDHSLRAIQKRALLSFYERHQTGSSWRSEPQLSPPPRPPPIPSRPRLPTPLSRRSSISSEYDTPATWNDDCSKDDSSADEVTGANPKELNKNPHRSSSCGSLSTAMLGPMVLGPSISIDDWVPELPPKKKQPAARQPAPPVAKREPSPDLPPPPPMVDDDEQLFVSDEPLPPPPPEAIWPKPESLKNDAGANRFPKNGKDKRLESSFSAVEEMIGREDGRSSFPNYHCGPPYSPQHHPNRHHYHHHNHHHDHHNTAAMSEKSKSLSYIFDCSHKAAPQTPAKSYGVAEPAASSVANGADDGRQPAVKEFGRTSSVRRNKLTIPNKDYCKSEFSARKSVFQGGGGGNGGVVDKHPSVPAFSATAVPVKAFYVSRNLVVTPLKNFIEGKYAPSPLARSPSVVGPLKTSGAFPPSLEPSCPPTLYQQSQSKASYLSAYKREPREREKGLPNFEGSYKRTASPNSSGRGDVAAAVEPQDVENVAPEGSDCCSNFSDSSGRLLSVQDTGNTTTNGPQQQQQQQQQQQLSPAKTQTAAVPADGASTAPPSPPAVLSERPIVEQQQQQSKTLPRASNATGQDFKRSSRTPRTQSDPSNMPNKAEAAIATLQMMMMPSPSRHSESASSLQKRSQSDLSQVGSTESGYSSLSLNAPSPSHSPTRLSSGDFGGPITLPQHSTVTAMTAAATTTTTTSAATGTVTTAAAVVTTVNAGTSTAAGNDDQEECNSSWRSEPGSVTARRDSTTTTTAAAATPPRQHRSELSCGSGSTAAVLSDVASQTDTKSGAAQPAVRHKLPEEIECEELSRDLISHLSPSDKLHNILAPGPDVKRSTDYVSPLFRMDLVPRSRTSIAEKLLECNGNDGNGTHNNSNKNNNNNNNNNSTICDSNGGLSPNSSYYTTSEPKAKLLNHYYGRQRQSQPVAECNGGIGNLQKKKADLVSRLDRKLKVLRDEQIAVAEETAVNETLGESVADRVKAVAKLQEANKFKTHVQEVGHITSLLLSLSGRLARAENALLDLGVDHSEKKALEEKKSKLTCQLEEAKELKDNIDRRGDFVSTILYRYLTADEYSDYDHFIAMKAKLLIDAREITDKIQLGEEQLRALKETLED